MNRQSFIFTNSIPSDGIIVSDADLYSNDTGYGFFTEETRAHDTEMKLSEINTGFELWDWFVGESLTSIKSNAFGCYINSKEAIPLSFKCRMSNQGNYLVRVTVCTSSYDGKQLKLFLGRRKLVKVVDVLPCNSTFTYEFNLNLSDIIPRGMETPYHDMTIDFTMFGEHIYLQELSFELLSTPTLFIAGDSTVTDQSACYPYVPSNSYCGWGQMLGMYLNSHIAVSNHAHSGLTTESFRSEGHYDTMLSYIKPGDFVLFQFAHNDQKLSHLKANEGYRTNLIHYIEDIFSLHATPVLVTPLCRNSWRGSDGVYNDLLEEYAATCIQLAAAYQIPLLDLHKRSYDFITTSGLENSKRYFFPGDFTHTNDYGGFLMAGFVAAEMQSYRAFTPFLFPCEATFTPPYIVKKITPPNGLCYTPTNVASIPMEFTDVNNSPYKESIITMTTRGLIPQRETLFYPSRLITRAEALDILIKVTNFFPTNVYNDWFHDVLGHEWYAGVIECAYSNGLITDEFIEDDCCAPNATVSYEELLRFAINGYKSRKALPVINYSSILELATSLGLTDSRFATNHLLSKEEAVFLLEKLYNIM